MVHAVERWRYQTLINDALRRVIEGERVVADVRLAVREEMARYKLG